MSNVGFRIYQKIKRPDPKLVKQFASIPVANICDNMGRIYAVHHSIHPFNSVPLLGVALTVKAPLGDNLMFHKAIDMAQPGDIIVVDGEGCMSHALCGEIMMRYSMKREIAGFVIDGCIRDSESLVNLEFPVYAKGIQPKGPYKNGPGEINVPVSIGGQVVCPGDILVGDADGVVIIKPYDATEVLEKAKKHNAMEVQTFKDIENGSLDRLWVDKTLYEKGCKIID